MPRSFALHANYPNPFRQSTRIVFDPPWPARVSIEVMDLTRRRAYAKAPTELAAGWEHDIEVRGGTLPSGLFLYRLVAAWPEANARYVDRMMRPR